MKTKDTLTAILAGEVASSAGRPASLVATRILDRLDQAGLALVHVSQARAVDALLGLDLILDLRAEEAEIQVFATDIGIADPAGLVAACAAVKEVLDGPRTAELVSEYYQPAAA